MASRSFRQDIMAGKECLGAMIFELLGPGLPRMLVNAGCRYVLYDMEHTGMGFETLKAQVAACRGLPIVPLARVPRGEYHFLARALDIGVRGVMVPMVNNAKEAAAIAEATRYPPMGRRGAAFGFAHDDYGAADPSGTIAKSNDEILVIAQIETELGLAKVDEIAATPGIDVLWVGHFDLTNFLGIPGEFQHERYLGALQSIVAAARKHGKGLGFMAANAALANEYRGYGFNMLAIGPDQALLTNALSAVFAEIK